MWISIGTNRRSTKWKNTDITWTELVDKLRKPIVTAETAKEYKRLSKDEQANIKDIGGFVGGAIRGGRRAADKVQSRCLITLDADSNCAGLLDDLSFSFNCAAVVHSTHKSTAESLRLRLVIPLDREVHADEYEAIARKVADVIGLSYFDPTTFQAERLMFWPSVPKDVKYYFKEIDGPALVADDILNLYADWKDVSQWPLHDAIKKKVEGEIKKQENPLEKDGLIGAFCRTYSISDAIDKYLPDIYEATDKADRYTYKEGTTAGGLVIYDDLFAYSHHSTDPISGKLCNAFDLVRLSLYADLDEGIKDRVNISKSPSFIKVSELILKDSAVKKVLVSDKIKSAAEDFNDIESEGLVSDEWLKQLDVDKKGNCHSTVNNVVLIFENDVKLKDRFKWDNFNHKLIITKDIYWRKVGNDKWLTDADLANLRHYFENVYNISANSKIDDGLIITATKNGFHPIQEYLKALVWDGVERLETLLIDYLGAEDTLYTRQVTRKTLIAAVSRVYEPGIKFDNMLMLTGRQGAGKSTLIRKLGGIWYSDTFGNMQTTQAMEQIQGIWLMELGELAGLKKAEIETIKMFVAKQDDRYRPAYGRLVTSYPRQCIFIGTTNEDEFLQDATGNRRFWPVELEKQKPVKNVFKINEKDRGQLWAEAVHYYALGEELYLNTEVTLLAEAVQDKHTEREAHHEVIERYLNTPIPVNWYDLNIYERIAYLNDEDSLEAKNEKDIRLKVSVLEIWTEAIKGKLEMLNKFHVKNIKNAMKKIPGWEYKVINTGGKAERGWYRSLKDIKHLKQKLHNLN